MSEVSLLLEAMQQGDPSAASALLPLVYDDLRQVAAHKLAEEPSGQTLQPTALVHEAYLRLVGGENRQSWENRRHFFAAAAEAMRRILVENARRKKTQKRGGDRGRATIEFNEPAIPESSDDLLALDEALTKLASVDAAAAELVHLKYFAGFTLAEIAELLNVSPRSADRLWSFARAWLHRELSRHDSP